MKCPLAGMILKATSIMSDGAALSGDAVHTRAA